MNRRNLSFAFTACVVVAACAKSDRVPLATERDIREAPSDSINIDIWKLPIELFPLLSKFKRVERVDFFSQEGSYATDEKLAALANLGFTNLEDISLLNCQLITDRGIAHLAKIKSLRMLQLEGTTVSDEGCRIMVTAMSLTGVNVANCPRITIIGLEQLATASTLKEITFSADSINTPAVIKLIGLFRSVNWCQIIDPKATLDVAAVKKSAADQGVNLFIRPTGALQDLGVTGSIQKRKRDSDAH
jgi:hypothetical protein